MLSPYRYKLGRNIRVGDVLLVKERLETTDAFYHKVRVEQVQVVPLVVSSVREISGSQLEFKDAHSERVIRVVSTDRVRMMLDRDLPHVRV